MGIPRSLLTFLIVFASYAHATVFEPISKWNKTDVRVCWLTADVFKKNPKIIDDQTLDKNAIVLSNDQLASSIQTKIQSVFTKEKTGIYFSGWKKCTLDSSLKLVGADAIIALNRVKKYQGVIEGDSSVGLSLENFMEARTRRPNNSISRPTLAIHLPAEFLVTRKGVSYTDQVLLTAVHEFGHLAGLHHEHTVFSEEAVRDPHCLSSVFGPFFKDGVETIGKSYSKEYQDSLLQLDAKKTPYDSNSVMSYCQLYQTIENGFDFYAEPVKSLPGYYQSGTRVLNLNDREIYSLKRSPTTASPERVHVRSNISLSKQDNAMLISVYSN